MVPCVMTKTRHAKTVSTFMLLLECLLTDVQVVKLDIVNMTAPNSATSQPISSVVFAGMLGIWQGTALTDSEVRMPATTFQAASMAHNVVLVEETPLIESMR